MSSLHIDRCLTPGIKLDVIYEVEAADGCPTSESVFKDLMMIWWTEHLSVYAILEAYLCNYLP